VVLEKAKVVFLSGTAFGESGEGFIRIACTVGVRELGEAFDRIQELFND
jgi:aspartate/methionine/tyrosine aminotransferase